MKLMGFLTRQKKKQHEKICASIDASYVMRHCGWHKYKGAYSSCHSLFWAHYDWLCSLVSCNYFRYVGVVTAFGMEALWLPDMWKLWLNSFRGLFVAGTVIGSVGYHHLGIYDHKLVIQIRCYSEKKLCSIYFLPDAISLN